MGGGNTPSFLIKYLAQITMQDHLNRLNRRQFYIHAAVGIESEYSEIIPLVSLSGNPFYHIEDNQLTMLNCMLPQAIGIIEELGTQPVKGGRLQDFPEAYATAIWMLGYFGYQTVVADPEHDYPPVLHSHLAFNLKVSKKSVKLARCSLRHRYLKQRDRSKSTSEKKFRRRLGTVYKPTEYLKQQSFDLLDKYTIQLIDSEPLNETEIASIETHQNRKFKHRANRAVCNEPTIIETLISSHTREYPYEAVVTTSLSPANIDELMNYQVSPTRKMSHGHNAGVMTDILFLVDYLQETIDPDESHNEESICGIILPKEKMGWVELGYNKLLKLWGYNSPTNSNHSTVCKRLKEILIDGLGWLEGKPSLKGNLSYRNSKSKPQSGKYRFTDKFEQNNGGRVKEFKCSKKLNTHFEVLARTTLAPVNLEEFNAVATKRKWKEATRRTQLSKLKDFDYKKGRVSQQRAKGRITTHIVGLPREFKHLLRIDGEETVELDLKTAHPRLIASFFDDPVEKEQWLAYLDNNDIYTDLLKSTPVLRCSKEDKTDDELRDCFKKLFNAYLNGGGLNAFDDILELDIDFAEHVKTQYPYLDKVVTDVIETRSEVGRNNGVAIELQELESILIGTHYMCHSSFLCISTHDGIICKKSESQSILSDLKRRIQNTLGYNIPVTIKPQQHQI